MNKNTQTQNTEKSENGPTSIPRNPAWVTGTIIAVLMVLSLGAGFIVQPMVIQWLSSDAAVDSMAGEHAGHAHGAEPVSATQAAGQWYVCPMHPWVVQPGPGICPICTMDLTPLDPERFSGEINIDPQIVQNIGIRVAPVSMGGLEDIIRASGHITYDETRFSDVVVRYSGWIENTSVNYDGAPVRKGEKLAEIYSPELVAAQEEFLLLLNDASSADNSSLLDAAKKRLSFFGMDTDSISELEQNRSVRRTMPVYAPRSGFVAEKSVNPGSRVSNGTVLYRIVDLSQVWVIARVYENQLPRISRGLAADVVPANSSEPALKGAVDYIYPTVDEKTREAEVRIRVANAQGLLKPGMYVEVAIQVAAGKDSIITVPREAVISTGERSIAFVSLGDGKFEPRPVRTGRSLSGGTVEILEGLHPDEFVVVSGQFLLDSESRIRESLVKLIRGNEASAQKPKLEVAADAPAHTTSMGMQVYVAEVLDAYLPVQVDLFNNDFSHLHTLSTELMNAVNHMNDSGLVGSSNNEELAGLFEDIRSYTHKLTQASSLEEARITFGYVGYYFNRFLTITGVPAEAGDAITGMNCGMFDNTPEKGIWIQVGTDVHNPFFGKGTMMEKCAMKKWAYPAMKADAEGGR